MERCHYCLEEIEHWMRASEVDLGEDGIVAVHDVPCLFSMQDPKEPLCFRPLERADPELSAGYGDSQERPAYHGPKLFDGPKEPRPERRCGFCRDSFAPCPECLCGDLKGY